MRRKDIEKNLLLVAKAGSHAYGTNTPESDLDIRGIFIASIEYYWGNKVIEQKNSGWDDSNDPGLGLIPVLEQSNDLVLYELKKFMRLALKVNPNILELLWHSDYYYLHPLGKELVSHRDIFLSQGCRHSYSSYAYSQLKRLENHRKWLLDPPLAPPSLKSMGIEEEEVLSKDEINAFLEFLYFLIRDCIEFMQPAEELRTLLLERIDYKGVLKQHPIPESLLPTVRDLTRSSKDFISLLHTCQLYRTELGHWNDYQRWLESRNPERAKLEARVGYDGKHASHLYRLLVQAKEILTNHTLIVNRREAGDADFLLSIRRGEVEYDSMIQGATTLFDEVRSMSSSLRQRVDVEAVDDLLIYLVKEFNKS